MGFKQGFLNPCRLNALSQFINVRIGKDNDREILQFGVASNEFENIDPGQLRHHQIQNHQIRPRRPKRLHGLQTVVRGLHLEGMAHQAIPKESQDQGVVIN